MQTSFPHLLTQTANRYRQRKRLRGGLVIFNAGIPTSWILALGDPHKWQPGIAAIDEHGSHWIAWGVNPTDGAEFWRQTKS
jgi:hypothetical protein